MSNNIIGIIVGVLLTLLLALYAGTSMAENSRTPFIIIAVLIFLIVMISLKDKVWSVLIISLFFSFAFPGPLRKFASYELGIIAVIPFYLFNVLFRKSSLTWNGNKYLDPLVGIFTVLIIALMVRFPVGLAIFEEAEYINSRAYFDSLLAVLFYITLSTVKTDNKTLMKVLVASVFIQLISVIFAMPFSANAGMDIQTDRFSAFMVLGAWIVTFCLARYSLWDMVKKPWFGFLAMVGAAGVALSGFRSEMALLGIKYIVICLIHRRYMDIVLTPIIFIAALLVIILAVGINGLPRGIQRSISFVPYIEVQRDVFEEADTSSEWRFTMWKWALDPRENLIKNYTWGDGFAMEKEETARMMLEISNHRGGTGQRRMAEAGQWHSGPITTIHRMGFVGLVVTISLFFISSYYAFVACRAYSGTKKGWVVIMVLANVVAAPFQWIFVFGDITQFHRSIGPIALTKLILACARNEGLYTPSGNKSDYVPLMIKKASRGPLAERPQFDKIAKTT